MLKKAVFENNKCCSPTHSPRKNDVPIVPPIIVSSLKQPTFLWPQGGHCGEVELYLIQCQKHSYNRKQWKHNFFSIFLKLNNHCCIFAFSVSNISNEIKETLLSLSTGPICNRIFLQWPMIQNGEDNNRLHIRSDKVSITILKDLFYSLLHCKIDDELKCMHIN